MVYPPVLAGLPGIKQAQLRLGRFHLEMPGLVGASLQALEQIVCLALQVWGGGDDHRRQPAELAQLLQAQLQQALSFGKRHALVVESAQQVQHQGRQDDQG